MGELFASGRVADLIVAVMVIEAVALLAFHHRTGRGIAPASLLSNLAAGLFLVLALRGALVGSSPAVIGLLLLGGLAAHLLDLRQRWRSRP
jgi:hypothetical protein